MTVFSAYDVLGRHYTFDLDPWYLDKDWRTTYHEMFPAAGAESDVEVEPSAIRDPLLFCVDSFRVGNVRVYGLRDSHPAADIVPVYALLGR